MNAYKTVETNILPDEINFRKSLLDIDDVTT